MKHLPLILRFLFSFFAASGLTGCATMIHGTTQNIEICSVPDGATAQVNGQTVQTPESVKLTRKDPHTVVLSKEGYLPQQIHLYRKESGLIWVNLVQTVPFFIIGMRLDQIWGGGFVLEPSVVHASLVELPPGNTAPACLKSSPKPRPDLSKADLTRPFNSPGVARICVLQKESCNPDRFRVMDGETAIGITSPETYLCWERAPGTFKLTGDTGFQRSAKELTVESGKTYFVSVVFDRFAKIKIDVLEEKDVLPLIDRFSPIKNADYIPVP